VCVHRRVARCSQASRKQQCSCVCDTHVLRTVRMVVLDEFALPRRIKSGLTMPRHHPPISCQCWH
jgi:hypothetical protein